MNHRYSNTPGVRLPPLTSAVKAIMIALATIFVAQVVVFASLGWSDAKYTEWVVRPLALTPEDVLAGQLWRLFTYMALHDHAGLGHLFFNLLSLYFFGPQLEERFGRPRFVVSFIACGVAGGVAATLVGLLPFASLTTVSIGASGAVAGIVAAFCWRMRRETLNLIIVQATGLQLLAFFIALDLLRALMGSPIAVVVHLGGTAMGVLIAAGYGPWAGYQRVRLWRLRRKLKTVSGGRDVLHTDVDPTDRFLH